MGVRRGGWVDPGKSLGLSLRSEALLSFLWETELKARRREEDRVGLEAQIVSEEFLSP